MDPYSDRRPQPHSLPEGFIEALAEGHASSHVARSEDLERKILELKKVRSAATRRIVPHLSARWTGANRALPVLDISNGGFSFAVEEDVDLEGLLPGSVLANLQLVREGIAVLEGVDGLVRHVLAESDHYRVGCSFLCKPGVPAGRAINLRDRALCASLLRGALKGSGIFFQPEDEASAGIHASDGQMNLSLGQLTIPAIDHPFAECDVVRGQFEHSGKSYRFRTAVTSRTPLRVRIPVAIEERQQRRCERHRLGPAVAVTVAIDSPLLETGVVHTVHDLSSSGFSFELDATRDLFPLGSRIHGLALRIGADEIRCSAKVKSLAPIPGDGDRLRCGAEFQAMTEADKGRLADLIVRARVPALDDGTRVAFDDLWTFFREARLLGPELETALEPQRPKLKRTFDALGARASTIFRSVVVRNQGRLVGHVSGLRAYRNTWYVQHLAALPIGNAAFLLNLGTAEFLGQVSDLNFVQLSFLPQNKWAARVFGGFARTISDPTLSDLCSRPYFILDTNRERLGTENNVAVVVAGGHDLAIVAKYLVATECCLILRAMDLTRDALELGQVDGWYRELGLTRQRKVLMAYHDGSPVGFALAELSSIGLNLRELFSSCQIYVLPDGQAMADDVRTSLLNVAAQLYRNHGRARVKCFVAPEEAEAYVSLGMRATAQEMRWTLHRSQFRPFCDHLERLFEAVASKERSRRHRDPPQEAVACPL